MSETTFEPAGSSSTNENNNNNNENNNANNEENSMFECNICLEQSTEPVITLCGHLFCWVCIYKWMQTQQRPQCPVCKSAITTEKLIPLYGRGKEQNDPRKKIPEGMPNRPSGHHAEPSPHHPHQNFGFSPFGTPLASGQVGGISFSAGIGFFPSLFGLQFQFPNNPTYSHNTPPPPEDPHLFISRMFLLLAIFILIFLLFF
eukprot:Phypoly_transcript_10244.p1 GENE.Phypoly_transcript_10244~~Phypoly_transcript_10244.p1  ORF type:complete len:202 (+),score=40.01 Phypoly_transcript_10244:45-650(+)